MFFIDEAEREDQALSIQGLSMDLQFLVYGGVSMAIRLSGSL